MSNEFVTIPRPPTGPRPGHLPKTRAGTRYVRRSSLPPLSGASVTPPGISKRINPRVVSARVKPSTPRPVTGKNLPPRHTAKSRARAAFLEEERAKFDEMFPPLRKGTPVQADVEEKCLPQEEESNLGEHNPEKKQPVKVASKSHPSDIGMTKSISPSLSEVTCISTDNMFNGGNYYSQQSMIPEPKRFPERVRSYSDAVKQITTQQSPLVVQQPTPATVNHQCQPEMVRLQRPVMEQQESLETMQPQIVHTQQPVVQQQENCASQSVQASTVQEQDCSTPMQPQIVHEPKQAGQQENSIPPMHPQYHHGTPQPQVFLPARPCLPGTVQQQFCHVTMQQQCFPGVVPQQPCFIPRPVPVQFCPAAVVVPGIPKQQCHPATGRFKKQQYLQEDFDTLLTKRKEDYAKHRAEKERFAKVLDQIREMVAEYEAFLFKYPNQLAKINLKKSVDVREAEQAQRMGDFKREFAVYQSYLHDLFFNKAQLVTLLNKEEEERKNIESILKAEIEKMKNKDDSSVEKTVDSSHEDVNEMCSSDECEDDSEEDEITSDEGSNQESVCEEEHCNEHSEQQENDKNIKNESKKTKCEHASVPSTNCNGCLPTHEVFDLPQSHEKTESQPKSRGEICKELNELGNELQQEILDLAPKFGRLLHFETAQNGRDHSEMLSMLDTLFTLVKTEHIDSLLENEELDNVAEPDCARDDPIDLSDEDKDEETGPIMPAFTSTSINTSCADSKATFEELKSNTSVGEAEADNKLPLFEKSEAGEHTAADISIGNERQTKAEPLVEGQKGSKMVSDISKCGKKQVSFVQEESIKPNGSNITFYARMNVNDLGELVSSALVSDLAPYTCDTQASSGENESSDCNGDPCPPIIGVKYVSVITKEKNTTNLRPAFAGSKDTKKNILGFTITGEILLSSELNISKDETVVEGTVGEANNNSPALQSVEKTLAKETEACDHHAEHSNCCGLSVPEIIVTVPSRTEEEQADLNLNNSEATVIQASEETFDSAVAELNRNHNTVSSVSCGDACVCPQSAGEPCTLTGKETGGSEVETQQEADVSVSNMSNNDTTNNGGSVTEADTNKDRNGLQLEFDVAALSSAMCKTLQLQIDPQTFSQLFIPTGANQCITLDRNAFMSIMNEDNSSINDNSSIDNSKEDKSGESACASDTVSAVEGQPEEQVAAPYVYRYITPSAINTTAELQKEMNVDNVFKDATAYSAASLSTASQNTLAKTEKQSAAPKFSATAEISSIQTSGKSETEKENPEMNTEVNTETAVIPYNSQIITLKVFPNAAESGTPCDVTLKKQDCEDHDSARKPNLEQALVPFDSQIVTLKAFNNDGKLIATYDTADTVDIVRGNSSSYAHTLKSDSAVNEKMSASNLDDGTQANSKCDSELVNAPDDDDGDYCIALASAEQVKKNDERTESKTVTQPEHGTQRDKELVNAPDDDDSDYCIALASAELVKKRTASKADTKTERDSKLVNGPDDDDSDYCVELASAEQVKDNDKTTESKTVIQPKPDNECGNELVNAPDDDDSDYCIALASAELVKTNTEPKTATKSEPDTKLVNAPDNNDGDYSIAPAVEKQMVSTIVEKNTQKAVTEASEVSKGASLDSHAIEKEVPVKVRKTKRTSNGSSHEDTTSFLSKIRNSIASFRRSDLEKAVKPPDKCSPDEKFGQLRQTKSKPIKIPIEPPRKLLLPRRSKANRISKASSRTSDRGPLKAMSEAQLPQTPPHATTHTVEHSGSGVKNSKSFRSQPSVINADITQFYAPVSGQPAQKQNSTGQLENIQTSKASLRKARSRSNHSVPAESAEAVKSERLHKPKSLPATLHGTGDLTNQVQMGKTQSETNSTVSKLPKI